MTLSQALAAPVNKIMDSLELAPHNGFHLDRDADLPNDMVRRKVNGLFACGASYAMVLRALEGRQRPAGQARSSDHRFDPAPHARGTFRFRTSPAPPTGRSSNAGLGEPHRLCRRCGHRPHPHCVLRDRHGEKL